MPSDPAQPLLLAGLAGDELVEALPLVLVTGALEQVAPRGHVGAPAEERPALPLGHTTPDTELDSVVERIRKALRANRASPADQLGAILRCSLDEQLVRVGSLACGACGPVSDPHVPTPLDRRTRTTDGRLDGVAIPGPVRAAALPRLSVRDPATYGSRASMPRPRHGHLPNSSHGLYPNRRIVTLRKQSCSRRNINGRSWGLLVTYGNTSDSSGVGRDSWVEIDLGQDWPGREH